MHIAAVQADFAEIRERISEARHPVAITGAGISVASGLPTANTSWNGIKLKDFFTYEMFLHHTDKFYEIYRSIVSRWKFAAPNPAHQALARGQFYIITQNIDGLHRRAGSRHVLELHGNLQLLVCVGCNAQYTNDLLQTGGIPRCPTCRCIVKPNIVLVGEEVHDFSTAVDWVGRSDLLLVVGTRLEMAPCRELPDIAHRNKVAVIQINKRAEQLLPLLMRRHEKIL